MLCRVCSSTKNFSLAAKLLWTFIIIAFAWRDIKTQHSRLANTHIHKGKELLRTVESITNSFDLQRNRFKFEKWIVFTWRTHIPLPPITGTFLLNHSQPNFEALWVQTQFSYCIYCVTSPMLLRVEQDPRFLILISGKKRQSVNCIVDDMIINYTLYKKVLCKNITIDVLHLSFLFMS